MLFSTLRNTRSRRGPIALTLFALVALALLGPAPGAAAQGRPLNVNVVGFSADDWPAPQAILTVEDEEGQPLADLEPGAFQAYLNDEPAPVTAVTRAVDGSLPIAVVLALDVSGSMEGAALDQAKEAAGRFLQGLGPLDTVAVLTFSDDVALLQPFTLDRGTATAAIDGLAAEGETALYDATSESARLAAGAESSRRAVVLLSDGLDNGSALSRGEALAAAETLGVPVFAIGLGDIDRAYLGELASATGGQFAETPSPEGLTLLYQQVAERLRGQYVVTLDASAFAAPRGDAATLRVDVAADALAGSGERLICPQSVCVSVPALAEGERLEAARTVSAQVVAEDPVMSVSFLVDGLTLATVSDPPYEFTFDPAEIASGEHAFAVEVRTAAGTTRAVEIGVQIGAAAGGSGINFTLIAGVAVAVVIVALVVWFVLRRRRGGEPGPEPVAIPRPPLAPKSEVPVLERIEEERIRQPAPAIEEARGFLRVVGGPIQGQVFALGGNPVSVGSGARCRIGLDAVVDGVEIPSEYARVWIRDGKLMVHELRRLTAVGSVGGRWEILTSGDMFSLGPYTFRFELSGDEAGPSGTNGATGEVPGVAPNGALEPARPEAPVAGHTWTEWQPEVPNILRMKPPADREAGEDPAAPDDDAGVPDILRHRAPPAEDPAAGEEQAATPNIFRDSAAPAEGAPEPAEREPTPLREQPPQSEPPPAADDPPDELRASL